MEHDAEGSSAALRQRGSPEGQPFPAIMDSLIVLFSRVGVMALDVAIVLVCVLLVTLALVIEVSVLVVGVDVVSVVDVTVTEVSEMVGRVVEDDSVWLDCVVEVSVPVLTVLM